MHLQPCFGFQHYKPETEKAASKDERNAARTHLCDSLRKQLVRDIPFGDLSRKPGAIAVYRRVLLLVVTRRLQLVAPTVDHRNARLKPITDFASRFQLTPPPSLPTTGLVLHPATM